VSTGELEKRPTDDRERALLFGAEFGLGTLAEASRTRDLPKYALGGGLLGIITVVAGAPVAAGIAGGPYQLAVKAVVAALVGCLFAACCALVGVGLARSTVSNRLYRYSGGLAQLVRGVPEPRVARWADVRDFTVFYHQSDEEPPRLSGFLLTTGTGASLPGLRAYWRRRELRTLVAEADANLAPRLLSAMTEAYDSGATVSFGRVQVSGEGITVSGWTAGEPVPWSQVKSVHMTYIDRNDGDYVDEVIVGVRGLLTREISVSGLANGIYLPFLVAHAAARLGLLVTGYHKNGGGIPGELETPRTETAGLVAARHLSEVLPVVA
jgi:hypothetical protein